MKNYTPKKNWRIIRKYLPYVIIVVNIIYIFKLFFISFINEKLEIALYEGENLLKKKKRNSFSNAVIKRGFLKKPLYSKFVVTVD